MAANRTFRLFHRFAAVLCALALACGLLLAAAPRAFADDGDLDEIERYDLTVTPNADGTLNITAELDWKVLDSTSEGPLEWVTIGIPNEKAADAVALSDTVSDIYVDGTYMHITFDKSYYEGETVHFAFSWVQSYMYTLNSDGSISYDYTPGWFDNANVKEMSITWKAGSVQPSSAAGVNADSFTGPEDSAGGDCIAAAANMAHGAQLGIQITYPSWPGTLSPDSSADNYTGEVYDGGSYYESSSDDLDAGAAFFIILWVLILFFIIIRSATSYNSGFGPGYIYVGGLYYPKGSDGRPRPGSTGLKTPPAGFHGMGGGSSFGGGAGRGGGGCACASSCACACACAGGGRAGCSAKNLYGVIHLPEEALADSDETDRHSR